MATRVKTKVIIDDNARQLEDKIEDFMRNVHLVQFDQYTINYTVVSDPDGSKVHYAMIQYLIHVAG